MWHSFRKFLKIAVHQRLLRSISWAANSGDEMPHQGHLKVGVRATLTDPPVYWIQRRPEI